MNAISDLFIVGGGINGAGIARDASGRGLTVTLCEKDDFAAATSSASSKLVHGGLRYLEHYQFRLVRESLLERETLLHAAPHIIWPLRFVLPHHQGLRPAWMLRLGLLLYDHMGGRELLPATETLNLRRHRFGAPLQGFRRGFAYSDCWVDDARLVLLNVLDAHQRGARILKGQEVIRGWREGGLWQVETRDAAGKVTKHCARALINAAGPWADGLLDRLGCSPDNSTLRLVQGSHIVVRRLYEGEQAYTFQTADGRVLFAIPYEQDFTLIGTTEATFQGEPAKAHISPEEITYLCNQASAYFARPVRPEDVVWSYAGVRPLYDDGEANASAVTREYVLQLNAAEGSAPLLSVFGGKITTYRRVAEHALQQLSAVMGPLAQAWTRQAPLPGGDIAGADFEKFLGIMSADYPWLGAARCRRMARAYGTRLPLVLGQARGLADLGQDFGAGLTEVELDYLRRHEWATSAEDALWRRSKLGLHLTAAERSAVERWFQA